MSASVRVVIFGGLQEPYRLHVVVRKFLSHFLLQSNVNLCANQP